MGLGDRWGTATCVSQISRENECAFSSLKLPGIKIAWPPFIMVPRRDFSRKKREADEVLGLVRKHPRAVRLNLGLPLCGL